MTIEGNPPSKRAWQALPQYESVRGMVNTTVTDARMREWLITDVNESEKVEVLRYDGLHLLTGGKKKRLFATGHPGNPTQNAVKHLRCRQTVARLILTGIGNPPGRWQQL